MLTEELSQEITDEKDFTVMECRILIDILNNCSDKELTVSKLSKLIETDIHHPKFYKMINYLFNKNILIHTKIIGPTKFIKVDKKKLKDLIDDQNVIEYFYDYFNKHHFCKW